MSYAEHLETRATIRTAIIVAVLCGTWLGFFTIYVVDGWSCSRSASSTAGLVHHLRRRRLCFFIIYVVDGWCTSCGVPRRLYAFFFWLGYVNSAVNPVLYTVFKAEFRQAFHRLICRRRCCRSPMEEELELRQRRGRGYSAPSLQAWRPTQRAIPSHRY